MGAPQITMIALTALSGGVTLAKHGQPRRNFDFVAFCISAAIQLGVMYWGGFFS